MATLNKTDLDALLASLFVVNTSGDIEADEVLARLRDFLDSYGNTAGISEGNLPMKSSTSGVLENSPLTDMPSMVETTKMLMAPQNQAVGVGPGIVTKDLGGFLGATNVTTNTNRVLLGARFFDTQEEFESIFPGGTFRHEFIEVLSSKWVPFFTATGENSTGDTVVFDFIDVDTTSVRLIELNFNAATTNVRFELYTVLNRGTPQEETHLVYENTDAAGHTAGNGFDVSGAGAHRIDLGGPYILAQAGVHGRVRISVPSGNDVNLIGATFALPGTGLPAFFYPQISFRSQDIFVYQGPDLRMLARGEVGNFTSDIMVNISNALQIRELAASTSLGASQLVDTETLTGSRYNIDLTNSGSPHQVISVTFRAPAPAVGFNIHVALGDDRTEVHTLTLGDNVVTFAAPRIVETGESFRLTISTADTPALGVTPPIQLLGDTNGVPYYQITRRDIISQGVNVEDVERINNLDEEVQDIVGAMVSGNTETNINVTYDDVNGKLNFVVPTTPGGGFAAPSITSFSIRGVPNNVPAGMTLAGSQTFDYVIDMPGNVQGNLTLTEDGATLATDIDPNGTSTVQTINEVDYQAGDSTTFTLSGTDTQGDPFSRNYIISVPEQHEMIYYGTQASSDATTFDFANESSAQFVAGTQSFTIPTFTGNEYLVYAQLSTEPDPTQINIGGLNQIGTFTKVANAFIVNSNNFDAWISNNLLVGSILSGDTVEIVR